jgi:hypothetical protein
MAPERWAMWQAASQAATLELGLQTDLATQLLDFVTQAG